MYKSMQHVDWVYFNSLSFIVKKLVSHTTSGPSPCWEGCFLYHLLCGPQAPVSQPSSHCTMIAALGAGPCSETTGHNGSFPYARNMLDSPQILVKGVNGYVNECVDKCLCVLFTLGMEQRAVLVAHVNEAKWGFAVPVVGGGRRES